MATIQLAAGGGVGGIVRGNYGTYQQASDGTYTVDTRDVPALLAIGMTYVQQLTTSYTLPLAPGAATVGYIVASVTMTNATLTIAHQPDVARPVQVVIGAGTSAITAGSVAVTYRGNDGLVGTDTFTLATAASGTSTYTTSRGVVTVSSAVVSGLVGGASPYIELNTTSALSLPVAPGAIDLVLLREYDAGATVALGTLGVSLASVTPTTAPNGTVTYSFTYAYISPTP